MSEKSNRVKKWRQNCKQRIIDGMGGACQCCGYNVCNKSLQLHHIDPSKKQLSLGAIRANPKKWITIVQELKKCILVCANCHGEIHAGIRNIPLNYQTLKPQFQDYKQIARDQQMDKCPCCGGKKQKVNKYCSLKCSGKSKQKVYWETIDIINLVQAQKRTFTFIGQMLKVSGNAAKKRYLKVKNATKN